MALPRPICTRIPRDLEARLEARFVELDWTPSEGLRAIVTEWLVLADHDQLEFRDTAVGRRAAVRGGPEVWEVVAAAEAGGTEGAAAARSHFSWVPPVAIDQALAYAESHPSDVQRILARNRRLAGGAGS